MIPLPEYADWRHNMNCKPQTSGIATLETLVMLVIAVAIVGIGVAAMAGAFSRETLDSYVMDKIVGGLLAVGVVVCVAFYGLRKRSTAK